MKRNTHTLTDHEKKKHFLQLSIRQGIVNIENEKCDASMEVLCISQTLHIDVFRSIRLNYIYSDPVRRLSHLFIKHAQECKASQT